MDIRTALANYFAAEKHYTSAPATDGDLNDRLYTELSAAEDNLVTIPVRSLDDIEAKLSFICAQIEKGNDIVVAQAIILMRSDVRRMLPAGQHSLEAA